MPRNSETKVDMKSLTLLLFQAGLLRVKGTGQANSSLYVCYNRVERDTNSLALTLENVLLT